MDFVQYVLYIILAIAWIFGANSRKVTNSIFKVYFVQISIYILLLMSLPLVRAYHTMIGQPNNNLIFFNIHIAIEACLLLLASRKILTSKLENRITQFSIAALVLVFFVHIILFGPFVSARIADVTACFIFTLIYSLVLYKLISNNKNCWYKSPEILTSLGLLIYFAGSVPIISMSSYLAEQDVRLYRFLFGTINFGLAIVRYLLLAISFILIYKSAGKNQLSLK